MAVLILIIIIDLLVVAAVMYWGAREAENDHDAVYVTEAATGAAQNVPTNTAAGADPEPVAERRPEPTPTVPDTASDDVAVAQASTSDATSGADDDDTATDDEAKPLVSDEVEPESDAEVTTADDNALSRADDEAAADVAEVSQPGGLTAKPATSSSESVVGASDVDDADAAQADVNPRTDDDKTA